MALRDPSEPEIVMPYGGCHQYLGGECATAKTNAIRM